MANEPCKSFVISNSFWYDEGNYTQTDTNARFLCGF